jgi:flagellar hook-basal body complex protein FliE
MMQAPQASGNFAPHGDVVPLSATHPSHFGFPKAVEKGGSAADLASGFANALKDALYKVNGLQVQSDELTKALAVRPDTVDVHDVTIAAEKARMALLFTKSIVERVTQAYKELINMR